MLMMVCGGEPLPSIPSRRPSFLTAGDKAGVNERHFYKKLTAKADERFDQYLAAQARRT